MHPPAEKAAYAPDCVSWHEEDFFLLKAYLVYLCFRLAPSELKTTNVHSILTTMFKNVFGTFEAKIIKILKNIQPTGEEGKGEGYLDQFLLCMCR